MRVLVRHLLCKRDLKVSVWTIVVEEGRLKGVVVRPTWTYVSVESWAKEDDASDGKSMDDLKGRMKGGYDNIFYSYNLHEHVILVSKRKHKFMNPNMFGYIDTPYDSKITIAILVGAMPNEHAWCKVKVKLMSILRSKKGGKHTQLKPRRNE